MRIIRKYKIKITVCLAVLSICLSLRPGLFAEQEPLETIFYDIKPIGNSVYQNFGPIEYRGKKANLIIFKTEAPGFKDKEVIFSDRESSIPFFVQREISLFFRDENITEEYFPEEHYFNLTKFVGGKKVEESRISGKGPIQNAILVPFSLRNSSRLGIGSTFKVILPGEFTVKLVSLEDVAVPAGKFRAYHFTSKPEKFEIWISADDLRIPVKIRGLGGIPYTMEMRKRISRQRF